ncbi:glycosyltransferase family 1 protein [Nocardioides albidus]|uniref:Glycosyltransferase family 1 protein n=1 Tax=Nocardioides albidus TaxID=1517589 RepID=A0A5C4VWX3_9ACTN|nr:glycosyltransferase [Nocardioides albidus]TNM40397.1 glycosyltransferase family 1 protein [Nocardioides albidus]
MRIVLTTEAFYPALDGTTTTLKATADRLIDRGHAVRIIAPGPGLASYRGCDVARVRPLEPTGAQVRDAIERFAPDLVQAHSPRAVGRKALKHAARSGVPTLAVEQSPVLDLAADYWRAKVAERADRVLVTSSWMVGRAAELGVEATLWEPGVDPLAFTPTLRDPWLHRSWSRTRSGADQVVVGYVGGLHKAAGVRRLAALADVPGIRLVVIGGGPDRDWLARRLPGARFTGPLAVGDLTVALPTLDLLVHPGEHETDCHTLREAGASGVPVVAPRAGGAPGVVDHLETGVLYDAADPRDLVRAVTAVAADPRRQLLGAAGRERALRRTWADAVDELVSQHVPATAMV